MPYIKQEKRAKFEAILADYKNLEINSPGELNYLLTSMLHLTLNKDGNTYETHNNIVGVLECVKAEFLRRKTGPYEDRKIEEHGDV